MLFSPLISMIIVLVDLDCHKCYNKIRKILCQLQDCWSIRTISFDDKSKTITIVGPFDPQRLACKLRCKGGKVIRDIHIVDNGGGGKPPQKMAEPPPLSPPPVKSGKHKNKGKPQPPPPAVDEPPPPPPSRDAPPDREMSMPARPCEQPSPVEYVIPTVEIPSWPAPPCGCPCCAPCYQGYYEGCRCCSCGRAYAPLPAACGGYRGCRTFSDEDPNVACTVM